MKVKNKLIKLIQLFFMAGLLNPVFAAEWEWQNPLPQGNTLTAIWSASSEDVFAVGAGGVILHYDGSDWTVMKSGTTLHLQDIWGANKNDVFAVGSRTFGNTVESTILHFDGSIWSEMNRPSVGRLNGIWGNSANDVFAVGQGGKILHYDGISWVIMREGNHLEFLSNVWGSSSDNIYATGNQGVLHYDGINWTRVEGLYPLKAWYSNSNEAFGVSVSGRDILHFDGSSWKTMENAPYGVILLSIWGSSANNVFATGTRGTVLHYDGFHWENISSNSVLIDIFDQFYSVGGSTNDVFVMGANGTILHYKNGGWLKINSGFSEVLSSVWGSSSNNVFAVGRGIYHYDGNKWVVLREKNNLEFFSDLWGAEANDVFAVGTGILHFDGSSWLAMNSGITQQLFGVWGSSGSDVFAVGQEGKILHYNGANWEAMNSGTTELLTDIWGNSSNDIYVVGRNDTILHYDGVNWSSVYSGDGSFGFEYIWGNSANDVFAGGCGGIMHYDGISWSRVNHLCSSGMWGGNANNVFTVGALGEIWYYDRINWSLVNSNSSQFLYGIWGSSANDIFAVGEYGTILHFDGQFNQPKSFTGHLLGNLTNNALTTPATGLGVNAITGNFYHQATDATMQGKAIPFAFSRSYNKLSDNKDSFGHPLVQPLGSNWTHAYNIQLAFNAANNQAEVIWGDGQREGFTKSGSTWTAASPGNFLLLTANGSSWQIETQSHIRYLFNSNGRLTAIRRAYDTGSGDHVMQFAYNANDELTTITDTAGRVVNLEYDTNHRLSQMHLPGPTSNCHGTGKRTVKYSYATDGRLRNVQDMNCIDHFYTYSPSTMQVHWAGASEASLGNKSSIKLKVTFDAEGRVAQQETGQNLTSNNGKYLFTWGNKTLTYQTPTGVDNAVFNWDEQNRVTSITRAGKTQSISYAVAEGPESLLPDVINDYENHNFTSTFTNTDLTELKLPDNRKQIMAYTNHDLTSMTTENELSLVLGRNSAGKTTSIVANGTNINASHKPTYTLGYAPGDLLNRIESATTNGTKTEVVSHHVDGQPLEVRQYLDATHFISTHYTYDVAGRRTSAKDQRGTLSCFYYDDEDNLTDSVRGLTVVSCPASPPNASPTVRRTHREYDAENRLTKIVQGFGSTKAYEKSYQYNATTGDLARTCGPGGGHCTDFHYDLDAKVEWTTRPDTRKDRFYELASGRIQITRENADKSDSAFDRIVRTEYDGNGRLMTESSCVNMQQPEESSSDCAAHSVRKRIIRDSIGRPTQIQLITDVANNVKRVFNYSYSANGLVTTVSAPEGQLTVSTRDATGNLVSVVEKNGTQTLTANYEYDGDGRLIKTISPDGLITVYSYDGLGRKLSKTDLSGTTTWTYNDTAGTVRTRYSDGTYVDIKTNRLGQVTGKTTSDGINITYTYDALGRLDVESWSGSGGTGSRDYDYTVYNEIDKITGPFGKVVDYSWDNVSRLKKITFDSYAIDTLYNGLDEVRKMVTPAGNFEFGMDDYTGALLRITYPASSGLETIFTRNSLGELTKLASKKGSTVITQYDISLDGLGRRSSIASEQPLAPAFGNQNLTLLLKTSGVNKGLIDKINGTDVDYDGRGNITALPVLNPVSMRYDGLNRLIQAGTSQHKYDAGRNRIETLRSGKTTRYLLDTSGALPDVLASMDDQNKVEKIYIHGPGGLLAEVKKDGTTRFVHQDFNHNVVALTDSTGSVVSSYAYTPFGDNAGVSGDANFPFRFAGGVGTMTDPEGIMYMRARYYHPGIQQFTSSDLVPGRLGQPQSLHRYAYVEGMALGGVDPSGLVAELINCEIRVQKQAIQQGKSRPSRGYMRQACSGSSKNEQKQAVADREKRRKKYKVRHRTDTDTKGNHKVTSNNIYSLNKVLLFIDNLLSEVGSGVVGEVVGKVDPTGVAATALTDPNALPASMAIPLISTNTESLECIAMVTSKGLDPKDFCQKSIERHKNATDWFKKGLGTID